MSDTDSNPLGIDELTSLVKELRGKVTHQSFFIDQLLEQIKLARLQRFGVRSEHYSPDHLPRVEIEHTLDDQACQCEHCQAMIEPLSQKISEQLDIIPAQVRVIRHLRQTYRCPECEDVLVTAPMPPQPIPKGNAAAATLVFLVIAKYLDGLSLFHVERQLKRLASEIPRATLANWMIHCGQLIQPLTNLMTEQLLSYDIIAMDESRFQVLREDGKTAQSQSYIWVQRGGPPDSPVILYHHDPSRRLEVALRLLDGFKGYLQTDAYEGYGAACRKNGLFSVGCMAPARRKFDEALKAQSAVDPNQQKSTLAATAIKKIQALYLIELEAKHLSDDERLQIRQSRSVPLLDEQRGSGFSRRDLK